MENDKDMLLVAILTFFTVFLWIFFEITKTTKTTTITPQVKEILSPINPDIDYETIDNIKLRQIYR